MELKNEVERARIATDEENRAIREEVAAAARDLERQLEGKDAEMIARDREMSAGLEELAKEQEVDRLRTDNERKEAASRREAEWQERLEELKTKFATTTRDLDLLRGSSQAAKQRITELEKMLEECKRFFTAL